MAELLSIEGLAALLALTSLEIILGIDNIVFIAIVCDKLPPQQKEKARFWGLALAVITRVLLLLVLSYFVGLTAPLGTFAGVEISMRQLVLLLGGAFLIYKATKEIHGHVTHEHGDEEGLVKRAPQSMAAVIAQILLVDIVFSIDSVITAVGVASSKIVMVTAILISVGIMLAFSKYIVRFVSEYPTLKMLALSFILLIGVLLVMEGTGKEIERGYIYFAMGFSLAVETGNILRAKKSK